MSVEQKKQEEELKKLVQLKIGPSEGHERVQRLLEVPLDSEGRPWALPLSPRVVVDGSGRGWEVGLGR